MRTRATSRKEEARTLDNKGRSVSKNKRLASKVAKEQPHRAKNPSNKNKKLKKDANKSKSKAKQGKSRQSKHSSVDKKKSKQEVEDEEIEAKLSKSRGRKKAGKSESKKESEEKRAKSKSVKSKAKKQEQKQESEKKPEKEDEPIKKIQMKGKVPIDEHFPLPHSSYHVLEYRGKVYSATLNQTNVSHNNNKFYILQIIQHDSNHNQCYFFTRWGRVGVPGQKSNIGPFGIDHALIQYESKYREKNKKGDYREVELNYEDEDNKKEDMASKKQSQEERNGEVRKRDDFQESKLSRPVKQLMELIFDTSMMKQQMVEIGYNPNKMPLGKLSKDNIMRGYKILESLMDEIKGERRKATIESLTNDFYSYIPHDYGFKNMSNFILNEERKVKQKIQMLESLAEIKLAHSIINQSKEDENQIDANYKKLNREIKAIAKGSEEFKMIDNYLQTTHATTHSNYKLSLEELFVLKSQAEEVRYTKDVPNKMLLWHGSRLTNFVGILSQGLRIAPPQAPVTGYMFGKGVYLADMSSKSANYCFTNPSNNTGILLLCEAALGNMNEKLQADYYASNLPEGKHSTKGVGRTCPDPSKKVELQGGVVIPMGPGVASGVPGCTLQYNEFIVYDIAQIKIKYLLRTRFNYNQGRLWG